ncbi:unnamed protein product [Rotaria sordida]|uniref:Uncharacterized protein n=1 Tax=Rotaria sordida TaxID=392033 RepID=A0A819R5J5_9BILA|nr:unnamed protein product [Rotaria sordida]
MPKRKNNKLNGSKKAPPSNSSATNAEHNTNTNDITNVEHNTNTNDITNVEHNTNTNDITNVPQMYQASSLSNNNIKLNRGANKSLSTRENHLSDKHSFDTRSNSLVVDNQHDRSSNIRLSSTQESFDSHEDTAQTTMNNATPRAANAAMNHQPSNSSSITFGTPVTGGNHIRGNFSQNAKSFDINRSIIRLPDRNSQTHENRPSTSTPVQLRAIDIQCSIEYRELEKKNKELKTKVANLTAALKIVGKQLKQMKTTHMLKPRPEFWNELAIFMNSNSEPFKGDGRTIAEIGAELGLNQATIQQVQQDAEKPDKVAMNIWRALCPTQADRLYVESVRYVPAKTLQNIYTFARLCYPKMNLNYKKMKNDIATNIRQSLFSSKREQNMSTDSSQLQQNDGNDDDENDMIESQEISFDLQSFLQKENLIDDIGDEEE